jgi:hypothetical protein
LSQIARTGALIAFALLIAAGASARDDQPADQVAMPRWDMDASIGLLHTTDVAGDRYPGPGGRERNAIAMAAYGFDVGHFWTQHVKSDVNVTLTRDRSLFDVYSYPSAGVPPGAFVYGHTTSRFTTLSGALTYQFFENAFMHPYVSGGVRLGWIGEHRFREPATAIVAGVRYSIPAADERDTALRLRSIAAVGCKSYFNERTFVRTEALVAFGANLSQTTFRIGAGFDF